MSQQFSQVMEFNRDVLQIKARRIGAIPAEEARLSLVQLAEEVDELKDAIESHDFIGQIDALIDLQYYTLGIFYKMGISPSKYTELFSIVHESNMQKMLGIKKERGDFGVADATKPANWVDPEVALGRVLSET